MNQLRRCPARLSHIVPVAMLGAVLCLLTSCNVIGYGAHVIGGGNTTENVEAEYRGLVDQRVAVLVSASDHTMFHHPRAIEELCTILTSRLTNDIEGLRPTSPQQIVRFQQENPYWVTETYGSLARRLDVDRIVYVEVVEYGTTQPGNRHVYQGVVAANISVTEADGADPNNPAFSQTVKAMFPPDRPLGLLEADEESIKLGMHSLFVQQVARLFHDHKVVHENR